MRSRLGVWGVVAVLAATLVAALPGVSWAQQGGMMSCGMGSGAMAITMILSGLLVAATIAALIALTVYLVRRSGPQSPART